MPGVRGAIMKALTRSERRSAGEADNVIPFPGKKARKKRTAKPKVYKRISPQPGEPGVFTSSDGTAFKQETINGKPHMRRDDGALFRLRKDGKWELVSTAPRSGRRKKGSLLPYAIGGAAAAGAGGYALSEYNSRRKK